MLKVFAGIDVAYCFMFRFRLTSSALGGIRFGISPLCEMGLSLSALKEPGRYPLQLPWLSRTARARERIDHDTLLALIDDRHWVPDFLSPRPSSPLTRIEDELDALARIDQQAFVRQLEQIHGRTPAPLAGPPAQAVRQTVQALRDYWALCFQPHWTRMRTILEADVVHRGRQIAQAGLHTMLNDLAPVVSFDGRDVIVDLAERVVGATDVGDDGFALVPTMFEDSADVSSATKPPMLMYPARGQAALWETERVPDQPAVVALIGQVRTRLLIALAAPASSTELAVRFEVTTSAVNQHLRVLHAGGLLTAARHGRSMIYLQSELGTALVAKVAGTGVPMDRT